MSRKKEKTELEKVEERREEVLAQGRKFKYPLQYAKHKLVINTILIALAAVILLTVAGWFALYKAQNTGDILYRITQVLPVPVAKIDESGVRYSDYLMIYRSSIKTVEQQSGQLGSDADAESVKSEYKRSALDTAEEYAYALKMGEELGLEVTSDEVAQAFDEHRKIGGIERSEEGFLKILNDNFGMTKSEYGRMLYLSLMKAKVMSELDTTAASTVGQVAQKLAENGGDLRGAAEALGEAVQYEETGGLVSSMNVDGGRAMVAMQLEPGQLSEKFLSNNGDGYYYVKLISKNETQVNYASLKIPFTLFDKKMTELREGGAVTEYIELEEI